MLVQEKKRSRNKDIKILHLLTDLPYSVCRERLKRNNWDLSDALIEGTVFSRLGEATRKMVESLYDSLNTAFAHVIRKIQEFREIMMENTEIIQITDEDSDKLFHVEHTTNKEENMTPNKNYIDERGNYHNIENLTLRQIYDRGAEEGYRIAKMEQEDKKNDG